jgi:hypothetical protein
MKKTKMVSMEKLKEILKSAGIKNVDEIIENTTKCKITKDQIAEIEDRLSNDGIVILKVESGDKTKCRFVSHKWIAGWNYPYNDPQKAKEAVVLRKLKYANGHAAENDGVASNQ